jgi:hypothetical protein
MADLPKTVIRQMQATATSGDHPDANLLGAFADKSLPKREQIQVLQHLSACIDCREIVALATAMPDSALIAAAAVAGTRFFSWPVLRWGALGACVVVIGAAVTFRQLENSPRESKNEVAMVSSATPETPASTSASPLTVSPPLAPARPRPQMKELVPGRAKEASRQPQEYKASAISRPPSSAGKAAPWIMGQGDSGPLSATIMPRWTLSSDGILQRSLDSGQSWTAIPVASGSQFRALAANGQEIWLGGSAGALYHSSDAGQRWTRVRPLADGEELADDVIGVEFTDTQHGKLTTASEEVWTTKDSGQTWQKQQ